MDALCLIFERELLKLAILSVMIKFYDFRGSFFSRNLSKPTSDFLVDSQRSRFPRYAGSHDTDVASRKLITSKTLSSPHIMNKIRLRLLRFLWTRRDAFSSPNTHTSLSPYDEPHNVYAKVYARHELGAHLRYASTAQTPFLFGSLTTTPAIVAHKQLLRLSPPVFMYVTLYLCV